MFCFYFSSFAELNANSMVRCEYDKVSTQDEQTGSISKKTITHRAHQL